MTSNDEDIRQTLRQLCTLVEALSVHQRQLAVKIEELHGHHEQLYGQQNSIYTQIDCLFSIFSMIKPRHPLPTMRGWPVSPDFIKILLSLILEIKPSLIVELGSGVSTLIQGYCLEQTGHGRLVSIDHDNGFSSVTRKQLNLHGLKGFVDIYHCPLTEISVNGESHMWYNFDSKLLPGSIDLLVVDGPPSTFGSTIRYPALPFFIDHLSEQAVIILDDAARPGEKDIVSRWMNSYDCFELEYRDTEKGTAVIRKKRNQP